MIGFSHSYMTTKWRIDGILVKIRPTDLDGDGKTGGVEIMDQKLNTAIIPMATPTELGESLKHLNDDVLDAQSRMSQIDLKAILHPSELPNIVALDSLVGLGVLPTSVLPFTRQKKRLSVSLQGQGRKDIVDLVAGKREQDQKAGMGGLGDRLKGFMGMNR